MAQSIIGKANLTNLIFGALPECLKNGTNPPQFTNDVFPIFEGNGYSNYGGTRVFVPTLANGGTYNNGKIELTEANCLNCGWGFNINIPETTIIIWVKLNESLTSNKGLMWCAPLWDLTTPNNPGNFASFKLSVNRYSSPPLPYLFVNVHTDGAFSNPKVSSSQYEDDYAGVEKMYVWRFNRSAFDFYSGQGSTLLHLPQIASNVSQQYLYGASQPILIGSNILANLDGELLYSENGYDMTISNVMMFDKELNENEITDLFSLGPDLGGLAGYDNGDGTLDLVDVTAPAWATGYPFINTSTGSTANFKVKTDEDATAYFVVLQDGAIAPSSLQVSQGKDSEGNTVPTGLYGSTVLSANVEGDLTSTNLTHSLFYDAYFTAQDDSTNLQATPVKVDFTTQDLSAPGWFPGSPFLYGSTSSSAQFKAAINEAGTVYFEAVLASAPNPDSTQVKLGLDGADSSALVSASSSVISGQLATFSLTGLNPGTYNTWFVAEDGLGNLQATPAGLRLTIEAPKTIPIYATRRSLFGNTLGDRFY